MTNSIYPAIKNSGNLYIRTVMANSKRDNTFASIQQMNNASFISSLGKDVILHHKVFGKAYGFETGKEVVFNAQQVNGIVFIILT